MMELLKREIPLTYLSSTGEFFGRLETTTSINIERQRNQFRRTEDKDFCLAMSKLFITGKIRNNVVVLRRYNRERCLKEVEKAINDINNLGKMIDSAETIESLMGFEGNVAKIYFSALSHIVSDDFNFQGRNKQAPKDPFNSLISFVYTLMEYEIYTAITIKGLHPYIGIMHRIKRGHPALASDLIEEWRGSFCDPFVLSLISNGTIKINDFTKNPDNGGVYLNNDKRNNDKRKMFIAKFEERIRSDFSYIDEIRPSTVRDVINYQVGLVVKAIEQDSPPEYKPIIIR